MNEFNFGDNLRKIRLAKEISQDAMAIHADISQTAYSKIERNAEIPKTELVNKFAKTLGVEQIQLLSDMQKIKATKGFEERAKELLDTSFGMLFLFLLTIPIVNAAHDFAEGMCDAAKITGNTKYIVRMTAGLSALISIGVWAWRIKRKPFNKKV